MKVQIQTKQQTNQGYKSKSLTITNITDYQTTHNMIKYLFETITENKGNNEVTITFKIPKREI